MAHPTDTEDEARDLFARQLDKLCAEGPACSGCSTTVSASAPDGPNSD